MKPLKIVISGFGPYAKKEELDLTSLGAQGLFLITGPTGSGKTTIFDAIAFALFGEASGVVRTADTLRSDFAAADTKTYAKLTFEHKGKIYRLTRNPRYERPKKTGEGLTTENADATLKLPSGAVVTGHRNVTTKVEEILGINYGQFKQIAMIAQGEFLELLLADSKERGEIFRRVFNTELYQSAQRLLKEKEREIKTRLSSQEESILGSVKGINLPEGEKGEILEEKIEDPKIHAVQDIQDLLEEIIQQDKGERSKLREKNKKLDMDLARQIVQIKEGEILNKALQDLADALKKQRGLQTGAQEQKSRQEVLGKAKKAVYEISPLEKAYLREKEIKKDAQTNIAQLEKTIKNLEEELKCAKIVYEKEKAKEPKREKLSASVQRLKEELPKYDAYGELQKQTEGLAVEEKKLKRDLDHVKQAKEEALKNQAAYNKELEDLGNPELASSVCLQKGENLKREADGFKSLEQLLRALKRLKGEKDAAQKEFEDAEKEFRTINADFASKEAAFFREQAGLLAASLKEGEACPVCGSKEHPKKAVQAADAPSEADLAKIKQKVDQARQKMQTASEDTAAKVAEFNSTEAQFITLREKRFPAIAGEISLEEFSTVIETSLKENAEEKRKNRQTYERLRKEQDRKEEVQKGLKALKEALKENENQWDETEQEFKELTAKLARSQGELAALKRALKYNNRDEAAEVLKKLEDKLQELRKALETAEGKYQNSARKLAADKTLLTQEKKRLSVAATSVQTSKDAYFNKLTSLGFVAKESYRAALKTAKEMAELEKLIKKYEEEARATALEVDRLKRETEGKEKADLAVLEQGKKDLEEQRKNITGLLEVLNTRLGANNPIFTTLQKNIAEFEAGQKEYLLISNLAKTANGELAGKQKLAFEQYVQAFYFQQILFEANKQLKIMTNDRFELLHKEDPLNFRSQTGLEIDVLDRYTGRIRSVKSLSGGESFKASLSLALGLSYVIESTVGGVEIGTLFVDEGFGSLDQESLDQALQTLVGLAAGRRLIGIISHVSELKERIDRQIVVEKTIAGSSVYLKVP